MSNSLHQENAVKQNKRVTGISYVVDHIIPTGVQVKVVGKPKPKPKPKPKSEPEPEPGVIVYDALFNSAPLCAQQQMQLEGLKLSWSVKQAVGSHGYGTSCEVGVGSKNSWWMQKYKIFGGVAMSDLPLRWCVHPSYNINKTREKSGVLLASYTWSQEAERIGALITPDLHDLARMHTSIDQGYKDLLDELHASYIAHYAYNWYVDPHQAGAFAFFGSGQYKNMYPDLVVSYGKYMIISKKAAAHHAQVINSIERAFRGVY
ncbi:hypothetical protein H2198_010417 [Neophaeococcomyces mojaviensis]|uniref:Uncharacterized protein n=1 Tax=Neophaeococcomyces mojaviensis TaxID=3383035 RepID=A0ACC2ZRQ7_9EURO|nr:hypothetical protein H2198_010417 [Knufia sp. JES_112]